MPEAMRSVTSNLHLCSMLACMLLRGSLAVKSCLMTLTAPVSWLSPNLLGPTCMPVYSYTQAGVGQFCPKVGVPVEYFVIVLASLSPR